MMKETRTPRVAFDRQSKLLKDAFAEGYGNVLTELVGKVLDIYMGIQGGKSSRLNTLLLSTKRENMVVLYYVVQDTPVCL